MPCFPEIAAILYCIIVGCTRLTQRSRTSLARQYLYEFSRSPSAAEQCPRRTLSEGPGTLHSWPLHSRTERSVRLLPWLEPAARRSESPRSRPLSGEAHAQSRMDEAVHRLLWAPARPA